MYLVLLERGASLVFKEIQEWLAKMGNLDHRDSQVRKAILV